MKNALRVVLSLQEHPPVEWRLPKPYDLEPVFKEIGASTSRKYNEVAANKKHKQIIR